jgi:alpha-glucosidase
VTPSSTRSTSAASPTRTATASATCPASRPSCSYLRELGIDAIWLTPFYPSPGVDHGYDVSDYVDVDPQFGTLADFDELVASAHALGIRVIVDIVPNHTSSRHPWFTGDRSRYVTAPAADGLPNNWPSTFGGPAWTLDEERDEYYLHLFSPEQRISTGTRRRCGPTSTRSSASARPRCRRLPHRRRARTRQGRVARRRARAVPVVRTASASEWRNAVDQPEVHEIYRDWRRLANGYDGDRVLVGEVVFSDQRRVAPYLRPDELQLAFNFSLVFAPWDAMRSARRSTSRSRPCRS